MASMSASVAAARIACLRSAAMLRSSGRHADAARMQHQVTGFFLVQATIFFDKNDRLKSWIIVDSPTSEHSLRCSSSKTRCERQSIWYSRFLVWGFFFEKKRAHTVKHGQTVPDALKLFDETLAVCRALLKRCGVDASVVFCPPMFFRLGRRLGTLLSRENLDAHYLVVITGAGNHSAGGKARLRPAIESVLVQRDLTYRASSAGCFVVKLTKFIN